MARAAKACSEPSCPNVQPCEAHGKKAWAGSTRRKRLPKGWGKKRRYVLHRDPLCRICNTHLSIEVDHIIQGDDHSYENLQGVCQPCHKTKTQREASVARG